MGGVSVRYKKPYLSYTIKVESSRLNIPKLSEKQVSLFKKICELKDKDLTAIIRDCSMI